MSRPVCSELLSFCAGLIGFGNEEGDFVARFEVLETVFLRIRLVGRDVFEVRGTFIFRSKQSCHRILNDSAPRPRKLGHCFRATSWLVFLINEGSVTHSRAGGFSTQPCAVVFL